MYFLYFFLICYSILVTVNTYVLLAADMADFRSIAKKFGPEDLADQIEDLVQDKFGDDRDEASDRTAEYSDEGQSQSQVVQSYEVTTERPSFNYQTIASKPRYKLKSAPAMEALVAPAPIVASGLSLDDIVERVKQKLQAELLSRNAKAEEDALRAQTQNVQDLNAQINTPRQVQVPKIPALRPPMVKNRLKKNLQLTGADSPIQNPIYETPVSVVKEEVQYETTYEEPDGKFYQGMDIQGQPVAPSPTVNKKKVKYPSPQRPGMMKKVRHVKQVVVPSKPIQRQPKPQQVRVVQPSKQIQRQKILQKQRQRLTQQKQMKKKQLIQVSAQTTPQTPAPVNDEGVNENVENPAAPGVFEAVDLIKSNDSYEDYVTPAKEEAFESDGEDTAPTVPTPVIAEKYKVTPTAPTEETPVEMEPLAEEVETVAQDEGVEYEDETPETTTIEPKAKTESISFEEGETSADPNASTIAEVTEKGKITKKVKMGTMIPTREFYKQSSPNYYAKLPTVAEKYNFEEPIPEGDRVTENLKPIGAPPSSINGKAILI